MFFFYSIVYTLGFILLLPRFLFDAIFSGKYVAGFRQRLGFVPNFASLGKKVVWLHCVSVGEVNAARQLALGIRDHFPGIRLVVSTTTRTGQMLARTVFADAADQVFYFPFDWRSTVRRSLRRINPSVVLLMETEIWFNFIRETYKSGARLAIVNGRLSPRSFKRFGYIKRIMKRVLGYLDLALMQENADATRIMSLGLRASKVRVTGNLKFDHGLSDTENELTGVFEERFGISSGAPLILAASTHAPEEEWLLEAFKEVWKSSGDVLPRLMIAPRHPDRFDEVAGLIEKTGFTWVRRSDAGSVRDKDAEVILLDSIGELRAAYPIAELVFVGGSLIKHGGQSIFEPAAAGRAIMTGPHTTNFAVAVDAFLEKEALIQLPQTARSAIVPNLVKAISELLTETERRRQLGENALGMMKNNAGAVERTLEYISPLIPGYEDK
jgi:3-deoxy-D-manno-octulosonic-acid transferase